MPRFTITTEDSTDGSTASERFDFPNTKAATDDAQIALGEMVRDRLPNGKHAGFGVRVANDAGKPIYRARVNFDARSEAEIEREGDEADAAADEIAAQLRGGPG